MRSRSQRSLSTSRPPGMHHINSQTVRSVETPFTPLNSAVACTRAQAQRTQISPIKFSLRSLDYRLAINDSEI